MASSLGDGCAREGAPVRRLTIPVAVQKELSPEAIEGLVDMFADAHELSCERFERRLAEETGKLRLDFADMKHDLLKWSFLFWLGQVALFLALFRGH